MPRNESEIRVAVIRFGDRKALQMQHVYPVPRRKKTRSTGTSNRRQAERVVVQWEDELRTGVYRSPSNATWGEFATDTLENNCRHWPQGLRRR